MKRNIALVTGGLSGESVISYKTADTINKNLDRDQFNVYTIDITPQGWFYTNELGKKINVDKNEFSIIVNEQPVHFDAVLIAMHGTPGEDGKLQGYFDLLQIPYTSCNAATSAITFNKRYAVAVAKMSCIAVAKSVVLFKHTPFLIEEIIQQLQFPVFVKPNNGGSSIGMSKVQEQSDLSAAIDKAFAEDNEVLIEEMIDGREFTVGVVKIKGEIIVLPLSEARAHDTKVFFDFEAKYEGKSIETTPAQIDEVHAEKIRNAAKKVYTAFNCKGVVRIDFILDTKTGEPHMLEVNTIPGQTEASFVPQQLAARGWGLQDFYTALIEECFV